jgi:hypothetical protein
LILSHHFGLRPKYWLDTLSMARLVVGNHIKKDLGSLAAHYGLAAKSVPYREFKGKHWSDLDAATRSALAAGCLRDVEITWELFCKMMNGDDPIALR